MVKLHRVGFIWLKSWFYFLIALGLLASVWYGCYWLAHAYAKLYLVYFRWGAYISLVMGGILLIFNEPLVILLTGAKLIRSRDESPKLWDAVQHAAPWYLRPGPRIYELPDHGMNAISFGWGIPLFSAVGATSGAIDLEQEELDAVMAHEVGHVINKDILVTMAMTISVMMMAYTGWLLLRVAPYSSGRRSSSKSSGGLAILVVLLVGGVLYLFGRLLGLILQAFVSRQREYLADATSARIMGSSDPLIQALRRIVRNPKIGSEVVGTAAGFLCTADPEPDDMMSTHPSVTERIKTLSYLQR